MDFQNIWIIHVILSIVKWGVAKGGVYYLQDNYCGSPSDPAPIEPTSGSIIKSQKGQYYSGYKDCALLMEVPSGYKIKVTFTSLELVGNCKDTIDIYDGNTMYMRRLTPSLGICGSGRKELPYPTVYESTGGSMIMYFRTADGSAKYLGGFSILFEIMKATMIVRTGKTCYTCPDCPAEDWVPTTSTKTNTDCYKCFKKWDTHAKTANRGCFVSDSEILYDLAFYSQFPKEFSGCKNFTTNNIRTEYCLCTTNNCNAAGYHLVDQRIIGLILLCTLVAFWKHI